MGWPLATAFLGVDAWAPLVYRRRYWAAQAALVGTARSPELREPG